MSANWAEENLKTIRCLMERASVYRRALAPVAITVGFLGLAAAGLAQAIGWTGPDLFAAFWVGALASLFGGRPGMISGFTRKLERE